MDWVLGPTGEALDVIELNGITAFGYHGALPEERRNGQIFRVDVRLHLDFRAPAETDDLSKTVDYAEVARLIAGILGGRPYNLLETVASQIAEAILEDDRVELVEVAVHKPTAPLGVEAGDVCVRLRRGMHSWRETTFVTPDSAIFDAVEEAEQRASLAEEMDAALDRVVAQGLADVRGKAPAVDRNVPALPDGAASPEPSAKSAKEEGDGQAGERDGVLTRGDAAADVDGDDLEGADFPAAQSDESAEPVGESDHAEASTLRRRRLGSAGSPVSSIDQVPSEPADAIVALGANIGEALTTLRSALNDLREEPGIEVVAVSPLARTAPAGYEDQPDFFNAVAHIRTALAPRALLRTLQGIEEKHGRQRGIRGGPRTLDLDLIAYDTLLADEDELTLPHPRAHERSFVLVPWSLMAPGAFLPGLGGGPVDDLARSAPDQGSIRWLAPDWDRPTAPQASEEPPAASGAAAQPVDLGTAGQGAVAWAAEGSPEPAAAASAASAAAPAVSAAAAPAVPAAGSVFAALAASVPAAPAAEPTQFAPAPEPARYAPAAVTATPAVFANDPEAAVSPPSAAGFPDPAPARRAVPAQFPPPPPPPGPPSFTPEFPPTWAPLQTQPPARAEAWPSEPPPPDHPQAGPGMPGFFAAARRARGAFRGLGSDDEAEADQLLVPVPYQPQSPGSPAGAAEAQFQPTMAPGVGSSPMPSRRPPAHEPEPDAESGAEEASPWAAASPAADEARPAPEALVGPAAWAPVVHPADAGQPAPVVYAGSPDPSIGPLYAFPPGPPSAAGPTATPAPGPVGEVSLSDPFPDQSGFWVSRAAAEV
ncbi:MAG: 2-amino-4-hydroxy-6-hydroxymethyldihydropteridine diphosphokinase [Bifidobacteriaceae bacterium]|jgi:dihydroneopterin aldolase/2-amino-4-hydroxy-6-hydroxymethyldihydropteridine diphosphokinase|nr:2-amino-4-hydroxy-6-hydroxymethyldihydropteridine diphosphokinase [Bifidobacteriaceae bacterium]